MTMAIRVLVVEDSLTVRKRLVEVLGEDPELAVVGEAADGKQAIELCQRLRPDVVTLDMMMPVMTGVAATEYIMAYCPTPILVVSASTNRGELFRTYDALAAGAIDVLDKPTGGEPDGAWEARLRSAVKLISRIKVITHPRAKLALGSAAADPPAAPRGAAADSRAAPPGAAPDRSAPARLVAIGGSTGSPAAVVDILRALPPDFPAPILLVIHINEPFGAAFAEWLDGQSGLRVRYPRGRGAALASGRRAGPHGAAGQAPRPSRRNRSGSSSGRSATAASHRSTSCSSRSPSRRAADTVACLLTGMGRDGALGLEAIRRAGGTTVAQDEATSAVFGMPREAILLGAAEQVLPLSRHRARAGRRHRQAGRAGRAMTPVLIVDDSLTVRMDLVEAFAAAGFEPVPCADGASAREALARRERRAGGARRDAAGRGRARAPRRAAALSAASQDAGHAPLDRGRGAEPDPGARDRRGRVRGQTLRCLGGWWRARASSCAALRRATRSPGSGRQSSSSTTASPCARSSGRSSSARGWRS